jgi:hypothetical protein
MPRPEVEAEAGAARRCVLALREHRVCQAEDRLAVGPLWQDDDLVFASGGGYRAG